MAYLNPYHARMEKIIIAGMCLLAVVPVLLAGILPSHYYRQSSIKNTTVAMQRIAENRKEVISLFLRHQENQLATIIRLNTYEHLRQQQNLDRLFESLGGNSVIVDLLVLDGCGRQQAYVGPYRERIRGKDYGEALWFHEVMLNGRHVSDMFLGHRGVPHFVIAVTDPLKSWVLRATINSEIFTSLIQDARMTHSGDAFIVNRHGEFQTPSLRELERLSEAELRLVRHHDGVESTIIDNALYVTLWLKDNQWLLLIKSDLDSWLAPFYTSRTINQVIVLITAMIVFAIAPFTVRFFMQKLAVAEQERAVLDQQMAQIEKMATIGRLAAGVAHEINNPLQLIGDQAGWMEELLYEEDPAQVKNFADYEKSVEKIKHHVKRAATVTHRLLGFSRKMEAEKSAVDINCLVEETVSFLVKEAQNNHIALTRSLAETLPPTMTDASQLQQVFLNIMNNAMDAVGKKGAIEVSTRHDAERRKIIITFEDSGPGIDPDNIKKIFDPFFTTKDVGKGTGLGQGAGDRGQEIGRRAVDFSACDLSPDTCHLKCDPAATREIGLFATPSCVVVSVNTFQRREAEP